MKIEITPGTYTDTVNGVTRSLPVGGRDESLFLNWDEDKDLFSIGLPGGRNYTVSKKTDAEDKIYLVKEYDRDKKVKEIEVNIDTIDAHSASYPEMLALSVYTDLTGYTKDFKNDVRSALRLLGGDHEQDRIDQKQDYYQVLREMMQSSQRSGSYQYYLSLKHFFDYYDKNRPGVPSKLL